MILKHLWIDGIIMSFFYASYQLDQKYVNQVLFHGRDELKHYFIMFMFLVCVGIKFYIQRSFGGVMMAILAEVNIIVNYIEVYKVFSDSIAKMPVYAYGFSVFLSCFSDIKPTEIKQVAKGEKKNGNLDQVQRAGNLFRFLIKTHLDLGKVFQFKLGDTTCVSMNDPKYIEDAISDFPDKANEQFQAYKMPLYGEDSLIYLNGKEAERRKKQYFITDVFEKYNQQQYFDSMHVISGKICEKLRDIAKEKKNWIDSKDIALEMGIRYLMVFFFGKGFEDYEISTELKDNLKIYQDYCKQKATDYTKKEKPEEEDDDDDGDENENEKEQEDEEVEEELNNNVEFLRNWISEIIDEVRERKFDKKNQSFIEEVLKKEKDEDIVLDDMVTLLVEGIQKLECMFIWLFIFMGQHPDKQRKMQREIDAAKTELGEKKCQNWKDFHKLLEKIPFTRLSMQELFRMSSIVPYTTRMDENKDRYMYGGEKVEKDGVIIVPLYDVNNSIELWGDQVDEFMPERFETKPKHQQQYCPFGLFNSGSKNGASCRGCPGIDLTHSIGLNVLVNVFGRYSFGLQSSMEKLKNVAFQRDFRFLCYPAKEYSIYVKKRE